MNPYKFLIPRLNGDELEERFDYYSSLVRKGVAGFIVFGGEVESLRDGIRRLQEISGHSLIIASDLEAGLGQQVRGGTLYPPSMAIARAIYSIGDGERDYYLERLYSSIASEALYAGINTILAPVLDINSNPKNPIIATRSFGEDPDTVSYFGTSMIRVFKEKGVITCGKHFPGHGDTDRDSHLELPVINKGLREIEGFELVPFRKAISIGVDMIMLGHLSVPCLDPSGRPATVSPEVVSYLRNRMGFKGLIITDAMNMGGLSGFTEEEASLMALMAGVDLILHPSDPDRMAGYIGNRLKAKGDRLKRHSLSLKPSAFNQPDFSSNRDLAGELFYRAITVKGDLSACNAQAGLRRIRNPFMLVLTDENTDVADYFIDWFVEAFGHEKLILLNESAIPIQRVPIGANLVVTIFSEVRAWKNKSLYFDNLLNELHKKVEVFFSFGNPYILKDIKRPVIFAYSTSKEAQIAMIRYIREKGLFQ